ncbi:unnamed protein product, partial [Pylaiella littoralis]
LSIRPPYARGAVASKRHERTLATVQNLPTLAGRQNLPTLAAKKILPTLAGLSGSVFSCFICFLDVSLTHPVPRVQETVRKSFKPHPVQGWTYVELSGGIWLPVLDVKFVIRKRKGKTKVLLCRLCAGMVWFWLLQKTCRCTVEKINNKDPGYEPCLLLHHVSTAANARFIPMVHDY